MAARPSKTRGSKYRRKIEPVTLHVAYEGASDEKSYFECLSTTIPKQFSHLLELIPVDKSSTASAPIKVYEDMAAHLDRYKIKLKNSSDHLAFLVIDSDHFFKKSHQRQTSKALAACRQLEVKVLCSAPSFDLWLLCHYVDVAGCEQEFKDKLWQNQAVSNKHTFAKRAVSQAKNGESMRQLIFRTEAALKHEEQLNQGAERNEIPPQQLQSNVGIIIKTMISHGIPIAVINSD